MKGVKWGLEKALVMDSLKVHELSGEELDLEMATTRAQVRVLMLDWLLVYKLYTSTLSKYHQLNKGHHCKAST